MGTSQAIGGIINQSKQRFHQLAGTQVIDVCRFPTDRYIKFTEFFSQFIKLFIPSGKNGDILIINTHDNVYIPAEDSYLLADNLEIEQGQSVLEIGTGSGIVAMYASKLTDKITVTDINFDACELARKNFEDNGIENIEILFGNLFEPVENRKFDVILFNTPYLPTEDGEVLDDTINYAFDGGLNGRKVIDLFLNEV